MKRKPALVFALAFLLAGSVLLAFGARAYLIEERFANDAREAPGLVLEDSRQIGRSSGNTTFATPYEFALPDGRVLRGENTIDAKFFRGARITVQYLESDPSENRIKAARDAHLRRTWLFLSLGGVFLATGAYLAVHQWRVASA